MSKGPSRLWGTDIISRIRHGKEEGLGERGKKKRRIANEGEGEHRSEKLRAKTAMWRGKQICSART